MLRSAPILHTLPRVLRRATWRATWRAASRASRHAIAVACAAAVAIAVACAAAVAIAAPLRAQDGLAVGSRPPASAPLETLDGKPADLQQFIGKGAVLFEFWASWCPNCRALEPQVKALAKRYAGTLQIVIVAVSVNQPIALVRQHLAKHPLPGVVLYDRRGFASEAYEAPATSYIVIVNAKGVVVYTGAGAAQKLAAAVAKAF